MVDKKEVKKTQVTVLIPVFEDFKCLPILLKRIEQNLHDICNYEILIIDDGSLKNLDEKYELVVENKVNFLTLSQNIGHQRSIAIGLCYLSEKKNIDYVLIMDGDGEDNPIDARKLLKKANELKRMSILFARRDVRSEPLLFRLGYLFYRILFRFCTGKNIKFGNFSLVPSGMLKRLTGIPELWNHYASSVLAANIPIVEVSTHRSGRIAGRPKMNLGSLVLHGISSITTFLSVFALRLLLFSSVATISIIVVSTLPLTDFLPTLLTNNGIIIIWFFSSLTLNSLFFLLFAVSRRNQAPCTPSTFWRNFIN